MGKRTRRQRQCREIYETAGFEAWTPDATMYGDNDIYNLFDILAVAPFGTPRLVQVSTNANGRLDWFKDAYAYMNCGFIVTYAQIYSGEGWRFMRPADEDGEWYTVVDERDLDHNLGEGAAAYLRGELPIAEEPPP